MDEKVPVFASNDDQILLCCMITVAGDLFYAVYHPNSKSSSINNGFDKYHNKSSFVMETEKILKMQ